jgi:hypothetical protein
MRTRHLRSPGPRTAKQRRCLNPSRQQHPSSSSSQLVQQVMAAGEMSM